MEPDTGNGLNNEEGETVRQGLNSVLGSILDNIKEEDQLIILSSHLSPVWKDLLQAHNVKKLGCSLEKVIKKLVTRGMILKKTLPDVDIENTVREILGMKNPDLELVAKIAWNEVLESGMLLSGERGGKRKLEGDMNNRSMHLASSAWRLVLGYFDGKLDWKSPNKWEC